jgi:hypothetical protein
VHKCIGKFTKALLEVAKSINGNSLNVRNSKGIIKEILM